MLLFSGIRNLLALRGDLPQQDENPIVYKYRALDMIRWIVEQYGDYFTIATSGQFWLLTQLNSSSRREQTNARLSSDIWSISIYSGFLFPALFVLSSLIRRPFLSRLHV